MRRLTIIFGLIGLFVYFALWLAWSLIFYSGVWDASTKRDLLLGIVIIEMALGVVLGTIGIIWSFKQPKDYWVIGMYWAPNLINACLHTLAFSAKIWLHFFHS